MSEIVRVPDIGSGDGEVIELFIKEGDRIEAEQSLLTLESDKSSMEIPAPKAGIVKALKVKLGDRLKEGDDILELEAEETTTVEPEAKAPEVPVSPPPAQEATPPAAAPAVTETTEEIRVPDIGSEGKAKIIELMVSAGDSVSAEQSLITLESDKSSMEIPCPKDGIVENVLVKLNDEIGTGDLIITLKTQSAAPAEQTPATQSAAPTAAVEPEEKATCEPSLQEIKVPDIGSSGKAKIIELMVQAGDHIEAEQSLITLESDKSSMEIPSPTAGVVDSVAVKLNDEVGTGDLILTLKVLNQAPPADTQQAPASPILPAVAATPEEADQRPAPTAQSANPQPAGAPSKSGTKVHAGPAVRMLAREFGVDLAAVTATGPRGRILKEDVQAYVKQALQQQSSTEQSGHTSSGMGIPPIPAVDFSQFGEVEEVPMTRLMQAGASNLHRSWLNIPHVTQHEAADITDLEAFRKAQKTVAEQAGVKLTLLPILLKACAHMLKAMPEFNSSLAPTGQAVIRKHYINIGFAVDTPEGLLVPVIRGVDQKSLLQLAAEAADLAEKARTKKLPREAMQGGCFTISSLGHIGGTGFTPIVNAPEVAILGVTKATMQPVWDGSAFQPRLMLPLSLSYDHRVINGAAAARFTKALSDRLQDLRTLLL